MRARTLILLALFDCSPDTSSTPSCPSDLPNECVNPPPSFKTDVEPILERRCWVCHTDGGPAAATHDFSTYDHVFLQRGSMLNQVYSCRMPPADAGQPTPDERAKLLMWFVCKAPDN